MAEGLGLSGSKSQLSITGPMLVSATTVSSYAERRIARVSVLVAGSTPGSVNDCILAASVAANNQVYVIPNVVGVYWVDFPCLTGIFVTPGAGQTVAVSYD